jgi:ubiquitin-conjugating enzyme E2 J2
LAREYKSITANPPPYITAHPSEVNILEWHYLLTGPPDTPYAGGQYWGTLHFPPDYPFKPPAIRMITPSGRFQPSTRLCLSISDFHPKSFNPAWEVSTILIGLLSFMTSEEMTTGSVAASEAERVALAARSRWWNSTGGGTASLEPGSGRRSGALHDRGEKFRREWPEEHQQNCEWMKKRGIEPSTGCVVPKQEPPATASAMASTSGLSLRGVRSVGSGTSGAVVLKGESWVRRHRFFVCFAVVVGYVLLARAFE